MSNETNHKTTVIEAAKETLDFLMWACPEQAGNQITLIGKLVTKLKTALDNAPQAELEAIDDTINNYLTIEDYFGIGAATATRDIGTYKKINKNSVVYNPDTRTYLKSDTFKRKF